MGLAKTIIYIFAGAFIALGFVGFILAVLEPNHREDMKMSFECELLEDTSTMYSNLYRIICADTPDREECKHMLNDIQLYDSWSASIRNSYDGKECLDIWK